MARENQKVKMAYAKGILQILWTKGVITLEERDNAINLLQIKFS